ncbi:TPA: hypothetical protein EYP44_04290 [Candidatus Bathyarchaeota archaeon]|nr:hypothetical protein [Candidatus Bathyarchaeota archaeon]
MYNVTRVVIVPGGVLLADSFDDLRATEARWDVVRGRWRVADGAYASSGMGDECTLAGDPAWRGYTLSLKGEGRRPLD